jgi:MFS family permease
MLASGIAIGIAAGIAFGGDWRRLGNFSIRWSGLLVLSIGLRLWTILDPHTFVSVYAVSLLGVGLVAARNWRLPGAALIAVGTFSNFLPVVLNGGMPYDLASVASAGAPLPSDDFHIAAGESTRLPFLADVIPVALVRSVFSAGDLLIAFGGFLIPFMWLQPEPDESVRELRSANFAFFWLAQITSRFGDPITLVALTFVVYRATQSALITAAAVGVATLPNALFSFFAGAIADAVGPRRAMFACDVIRAILIGTVPVLLLFHAPAFVILVSVFLAGLCGAVFAPARGALVRALVTRDHLAAGNSLVYASDRAVEIAGALAGGVLVATVGEGAFYVDALTFAISAVLIARVSVRETTRRLTLAQVVRDARDGFLFIRNSAVLWSNTVFSLVAQFANPVINTLTPVFLIRKFAGNDPVSGAVLYAGSEAAIALGAVAASSLLPRYLRSVRKGRALIVGFATTGVVIMAIAVAPSYAVAIVLFVMLGITNVIFFVPNMTITQERTPQEMVGRVFGARIALANLSWLPIIFLGGVVGDLIGVDRFLALAGLVTLLTALVGALLPVIRDVP